jgi:hypothetical protein
MNQEAVHLREVLRVPSVEGSHQDLREGVLDHLRLDLHRQWDSEGHRRLVDLVSRLYVLIALRIADF